jgi:DNA-binding protein HU-beta
MAAPLVTQAQLVRDISDEVGISRESVKEVLVALDNIAAEYLEEANRVRIGSLVQLEIKVKAARKARKGRNPRTGEEIDIPKKPATAVVKARLLKGAKEAVPSVQKARKRLA